MQKFDVKFRLSSGLIVRGESVAAGSPAEALEKAVQQSTAGFDDGPFFMASKADSQGVAVRKSSVEEIEVIRQGS